MRRMRIRSTRIRNADRGKTPRLRPPPHEAIEEENPIPPEVSTIGEEEIETSYDAETSNR